MYKIYAPIHKSLWQQISMMSDVISNTGDPYMETNTQNSLLGLGRLSSLGRINSQ